LSTAASRAGRSIDGRARRKEFSLKAISVTRSAGRSAERNRFTASFIWRIESVMLSLMSTPTTSSRSTFTDPKKTIGWRTPSS
jgi:hypothetical protein